MSFNTLPEPYYSFKPDFLIELKPKDFSLFWIAVCVLVAHIMGLWFTSFSSPPKEIPHQKVVVKTVQLHPRNQPLNPITQKTAAAPTALPKENPMPAPQTLPEPKKEVIEEIKIEKKEITPAVAVPVKTEEIAVVTQTHISEPTTSKMETSKEQPKNQVNTPQKEKKETTVKSEKKIAAKSMTQPKPSPTKKTATPTKKTSEQAPVKKPASVSKTKPEVKKGPSAEELAALEAEKVHQQEVAAAKAHQQELLAKAKENVAKIGDSRDKIGTTKIASLESTTIPQQLGNLQIDALPVGTETSATLSVKEANYRDEVAYRLKLGLKLPDYGEVKIKLTLNRSGKVASVSILSSENAKNSQYVERTVPSLLFPAFGDRFADASQYTFMITLNNDR